MKGLKNILDIRKKLLIIAGEYGCEEMVVTRINNLLTSIEDGVVAESSACDHLKRYIKDVEKTFEIQRKLALIDAEYVDGNKYPTAKPKLSAEEAQRRRELFARRDHYAIGDEYGCIKGKRGSGEYGNSSAGLFITAWNK